MWNNEVKGRHRDAVPFLYDVVCWQSRHAKKNILLITEFQQDALPLQSN